MNDEVMSAHRVLQAPGQPLELLLESLVLEPGDPPAAVTHGMVVVLAARDDGLEARAAVPELDPLHQPHVVQEVEGAVDAGETGIAARAAQPLVDLLRGQTAILSCEQSHHRIARTAGAVSGLGKRRPRRAFPISRRLVTHGGRLAAK
jgi:hypothetical protein